MLAEISSRENYLAMSDVVSLLLICSSIFRPKCEAMKLKIFVGNEAASLLFASLAV